MKRRIHLLALLLSAALLSACSLSPAPPDPADATEMSRIYASEATVTGLNQLLKELDCGAPIEDDAALEGAADYTVFTVQDAAGDRREYRLLHQKYLKSGENWFDLSPEDARRLTEFLDQHDSEDGYLPNPEPANPTLPLADQ